MAETRREWLRGAIALAVLIGLILVLAPPGGRVSIDQRLTTLRTSPDGAAALYEVLRALDVPVDRRMTPLDGPAPLGEALAILDPTELLTAAEVDALLAWIGEGGTLIAAIPYTPLLDELGVGTDNRVPADLRSTPARPGPWTAGLDSVGPVRLVLEVDRDESPLRDLEFLVAGEDTTEIVALRARLGAGWVLLFSDPAVLSNERIGESGAALLFARAAAEATASGPLIFDEYHHGHRGATPTQAFFRFMGGTRPGWLLLQLAAVALLAGLPAAIRFGAPVVAGAPPRRSPLEHVSALGEVYRQARAAELARRRLLTGFARRLGRERPAPGDELAFIERIARGAPGGEEAVRGVGKAWEDEAPVRELAARIDQALNRLNRTA